MPHMDYQDLEPGLNEYESVRGFRRILHIILGVILVFAGIAMLFIPGPGIVTVLVGLNLIKPDNRLFRYIRARTPGIPDDGPIPRKTIVIGVVTMVTMTTLSILFGATALQWAKDLI